MWIIIIVYSALLPILTITAFVVGYNANASKKILVKPKKREKTEDELLLDRIDALSMGDF